MAALAIDPVGAESQVRRDLVEERVLERLGERDALRRLVVEHALDQVEEQRVVLLVRHLVALERLAVLAHVPARRALLVPVEPAVVEVLGLRLAAHPAIDSRITREPGRSSIERQVGRLLPVRNGSENALHHGQVLAVVVRLEQRHPQVQLEQDAADRPDVARLRPAEFCGPNSGRSVTQCSRTRAMNRLTQDHLGGAVVARRHDGAVVLVVERGAAKVDEPHVGPLYAPVVPLL